MEAHMYSLSLSAINYERSQDGRKDIYLDSMEIAQNISNVVRFSYCGSRNSGQIWS